MDDIVAEAERIASQAQEQFLKEGESTSLSADVLRILGDDIDKVTADERASRAHRAMTAIVLESEARAVTEYRGVLRILISMHGLQCALKGDMAGSDALKKALADVERDDFEAVLRAKAKEELDGNV